MPTSRLLGTLRVDDSGADDGGPPVVLLPGLTFDRGVWAPVVQALQARAPGCRVVAVDLPGHGESPAQPPHDLPRVAEVLHAALEEGEVRAPLVVGHSMSGGLVGLYAGEHATSGVVNVDQPPVIAPFAQLLLSLEPRLRGADFDRTWQEVFAASFHTELLPEAAQRLVATRSRPSRELVLGYWRMLLDEPAEQGQSVIDASCAELARREVPYLLLLGAEPPPPLLHTLRRMLPALELEVWTRTGHFPHLAHPERFAELLLARRELRSASRAAERTGS